MKSIMDVIHEKEELLQQRQMQVKMLEEQLAKLRIAADIIADDEGEVLAVNPPDIIPVSTPAAPKSNGRNVPTGLPKNWP
jgi:hypothetical protein